MIRKAIQMASAKPAPIKVEMSRVLEGFCNFDLKFGEEVLFKLE